MRRVLTCLLLLVLAAFGLAQDPVKWSGRLEPASPKPGQKATLFLTARIDKGWHVYSMTEVKDGPFPSTVELTKSAAISEIGKPEQPQPISKFDANFQKTVEYYEDTFEFSIPFRVAKTGKGETTFSGTVTYQTCTNGKCLNPQPRTVEVKANIAGAAVEDTSPLNAQAKPKVAATAPQNKVDEAKKKGLISYLLVAVLAGFGALVTPCVFPMIPITVSFFSKKKNADKPREGLKQAIWYVAGIIGTFTILGVAVSALFGATGIQTLANNPYVNLTLFIVFVALAMSLFGVFEIGLPSALLNKFDGSQKAGFVGPVLMGLTFSLTSFTCTLPFVGSVLFSASQGDLLWPVLGMLAFSTAFALPFFLLALFPQWLSRLPKSGAWLATTKAFMGFIELAAAVKFLSSVDLGIVPGGLGFVTREVFLTLWFIIAGLAGLYMIGAIRLPKVDEGPKIGVIRRLVGLASIAGAVFLLGRINGGALGDLDAYLPPSPYPGKVVGKTTSQDNLTWNTDIDAAKALAKKENKPIFIDFTGIYCTNCRWMERNMFPDPNVNRRLKDYVLVQLYTDRPTASDKANLALMKELTNSVTLPAYVTLATDGTVGATAYTTDHQEFVSFLDKALPTRVASR